MQRLEDPLLVLEVYVTFRDNSLQVVFKVTLEALKVKSAPVSTAKHDSQLTSAQIPKASNRAPRQPEHTAGFSEMGLNWLARLSIYCILQPWTSRGRSMGHSNNIVSRQTHYVHNGHHRRSQGSIKLGQYSCYKKTKYILVI